jgi:glucosamine-6-phosphate deaminase
MAQDVEEECRNYDRSILNMGGIDLQILGIGNNGHIGFNEPDIKFEATTHRVKLDDETIEANARFFATIEEVPRFAISMGIKTIMHAKKLVLLASGENKAEVLYHALFGGITPEIPASILQLHQDVTVIVEESAAHLVKHKYQNHRI